VVDALPACAIRPACRWWQQEGKAACQRCPQVVTQAYAPSERVTRQPIRPTVTTTNRRDYSKPYENKALAAFRESYRRLHGGG
jgi:hypothetical protein